jgi:hypothetical protein
MFGGKPDEVGKWINKFIWDEVKNIERPINWNNSRKIELNWAV